MFEYGKISKYRNVIYGISIIWIVVFHCYQSFGSYLNDIPGVFSTIFKYGNMGVDVFLFLSGISMYFSMKKREGNILQFYYNRIFKIVKIYLLLCVPFLHYEYFVGRLSLIDLRKQLLFYDDHVSLFWYLACIVICYLIYPLIYSLLQREKVNVVLIVCFLYILFLGYLSIKYVSFYSKYEVLLARIPIFVIGSLWGKKVLENKKMNPYLFLLLISSLALRGPVSLIIHKYEILDQFTQLFFRITFGIQAIGVVLLLVLIIDKIQKTKIYSLLGWIGTFTLEIYIVHAIFRSILLDDFHINPTNTIESVVWTLLFVISSIGLSYFITKLENLIIFK